MPLQARSRALETGRSSDAFLERRMRSKATSGKSSLTRRSMVRG
jgi:hypothetical protein